MAIAQSRFRTHFTTGSDAQFELGSNSIVVDVPSSVHMSSPKIAYILPLFRRKTTSNGGAKTEENIYAIRIYVRRPWFESGPGERLAIGCTVGNEPVGNQASLDKRITQWGEDPLERPGLASTTRVPRASDFASIKSVDKTIGFDENLYPNTEEEKDAPVIYRDNMLLPSTTE